MGGLQPAIKVNCCMHFSNYTKSYNIILIHPPHVPLADVRVYIYTYLYIYVYSGYIGLKFIVYIYINIAGQLLHMHPIYTL